MDQAINLFDYMPVFEPEMDLADFPWFLPELGRLADGYSGGHIEDMEGIQDPQVLEAGPSFYYVPADTSSPSSTTSTTTDTMPPQAVGVSVNHTGTNHEDTYKTIAPVHSSSSFGLPDTSASSPSASLPSMDTNPPQVVGASVNNTDASHENHHLSKATPPPTITHNRTKRRLSEVVNLAAAKRARQLNQNKELEIFGPHFGDASASNASHPLNVHPPRNPYAALKDPGYMLLLAHASQSVMWHYPYGSPTGMGHSADLGHPIPAYNDTFRAVVPPVPHRSQSKKSGKPSTATPRTQGGQLTAPLVLHFEDSSDPARRKTIAAHRANEARTNNAHSIICLWTNAGATEPCHESCKDTNALLAHCVRIHGISGAKGDKEITSCAWADCIKERISQGGLKRHLKEVHGRQGRVRRTKTQGGSAAA